MLDFLSGTWPWYVAGPLIGLMVPALLLLGGKLFGVSSNLRHMCAVFPTKRTYFQYDWKQQGLWNLTFILGVVIGGYIGGTVLGDPDAIIGIAEATKADLRALGITDYTGFVPAEVFSWAGLVTGPGLVMIVLGGFLVGFGARYAGGCTSGHAITGVADLQGASIVAAVSFFAGGLLITHLVLPLLL